MILGVTTIAAVQGLGNLLLVALVLAPGAAALNLARRLPVVLALSVLLAALAGVAGLLVSFHLEIAAGGVRGALRGGAGRLRAARPQPDDRLIHPRRWDHRWRRVGDDELRGGGP